MVRRVVLAACGRASRAWAFVGILAALGFVLAILFLFQRALPASAGPDGPSALAIAADWPPDVVLLDLGLPHMDGYEVAKRLRGELKLSNAKIYALSGFAEDRVLERAVGIDRHLTKPVKLAELRKLIDC